jgi:predicted O-methyltransferase YrrM
MDARSVGRYVRNRVAGRLEEARVRRGRVRITTRRELLNYLALQRGYRRYLEIGVRDPLTNLDRIRCAEKHGVDPAPRRGSVSHRMTSDEFFAALGELADPPVYDLIFVDGLHEEGQVRRDVENALRHLSPRGTIVMHDCNPATAAAQVEDYDGFSHWNGTAWKAYAQLRTRADLSMCVVDVDEGCGIVERGEQRPFPIGGLLDYAFLETHRRELLNLISVQQFLDRDVPGR